MQLGRHSEVKQSYSEHGYLNMSYLLLDKNGIHCVTYDSSCSRAIEAMEWNIYNALRTTPNLFIQKVNVDLTVTYL